MRFHGEYVSDPVLVLVTFARASELLWYHPDVQELRAACLPPFRISQASYLTVGPLELGDGKYSVILIYI